MRRAFAVLAWLVVPAAAEACAVCGAAVDRNRTAFLVTTILLSLLPLALMGAGIAWIAVRSRGRAAGEFTERGLPLDAARGRAGSRAADGDAPGRQPAGNGCAPAGGPAGATW